MGVLTERGELPLLSDYTAFARRHRAVIGLLTLAGLVVGYGWALLQPSTYSATASVALTPVPVYVVTTAGELVAPEVSIDTDAQLLHSPRVLGAVGDALGIDEAAASEHLSVTATPNSHVLHVTVTAASAVRAADAADAAATAFVDTRREALGSLRPDQLRQLGLRVSQQEDALADEQARDVVIPARDELFAQLLALRTGLDELLEARDEPAVVLGPAVPPTSPDYANTEVPVASGAMVGLLCGCLAGARRDLGRRPDRRPPHEHTPAQPSGSRPDHGTRHEDHHHV